MRRPKGHQDPGVSVEVDWFGALPAAHLKAFRSYAKELEAAYCLFSISLNEAIDLHESGLLTRSFQAIAGTPPLCGRLTNMLENLFLSLAEHSKKHGTDPSISALDPEDFHGDWERRSALKSLMWHCALLTRESQFQNKIRTLRSMVDHMGREFGTTAEALASQGIAIDSSDLWTAMDAWHFDLNTCVRESLVMLKCFLRVLPDDELRGFQETVSNNKNPKLGSPPAKAKANAAATGMGGKRS